MEVLLDGKVVRNAIAAKLSAEIAKLGKKPTLAIIQVGDDERSSVYIGQKKIFGEKIGCSVDHVRFASSVPENEIVGKITELNRDERVHGIIVQLPLPSGFDEKKITEAIDPKKDVDGLHSENMRRLEEDRGGGFVPATAKGVLSLLDFYKISIKGKKAAVIGRSRLVGRPVALLLAHRGASVTVCHRGTKDVPAETRKADIFVAAAGHPALVTNDFVRPGQVVIDVGITKRGDKIVGDVDFEAVSGVVSAITPVPGGIGPLTVVSLFENLLIAYQEEKGLK
ncbi:MAG: bifunctional 5,10-methylenetetrahydrofolate dehydrogenase/5,10-methenyltetrahydrofolate cyclohydrolase [Patescibacteria group bacterium]|nr:bifunctional 5,10-methylenetetrahydrofolate dehydrogenase/5,10-methenyltetrahydrofolate cyclohydrolase [Patescibacteria group bacterium]MDE1945792.1 bifunctional 5,10-methylenetetrahydrofolate dehydrogenase/5,10-methenyltetrahydrofolate cyclohydrolase [Patescibacteria group bacterium]